MVSDETKGLPGLVGLANIFCEWVRRDFEAQCVRAGMFVNRFRLDLVIDEITV